MGNPPAKPENNAGRGWGALERGIPRDMRAAELGAWHRAPSSSPCFRQAPNPAVPKDNRDVVLPTAPMPAAWISLREIWVLNRCQGSSFLSWGLASGAGGEEDASVGTCVMLWHAWHVTKMPPACGQRQSCGHEWCGSKTQAVAQAKEKNPRSGE